MIELEATAETEAAIAAATKEVEWAVELLIDGELSTLRPKDAHRDVEWRLEARSTVAAEAVGLALADIREMSLDGKNPKVVRTIASLYAEDLVMGRVERRGRREPSPEDLKAGWHRCDANRHGVTKAEGPCACGFDRAKVCGSVDCNGFLCPWHCY